MKLLLTGVSGLLGINFAQEMMNEFEIIGVDRGKLVSAPFKILKHDLLEAGIVETILDKVRPDWVVNCAALADLDLCENDPELAKLLNTNLPRQIARACKEREITLAHISTDAVFDGQKDGFYGEDDSPSPIGVYARTKLDGEWAVLTENPKAIVARVNFYGWSLSGRRSLAEFFYNNLSHSKSMSGFTDVIFCPMLVNDTARTIVKMLDRGLKGLYHLLWWAAPALIVLTLMINWRVIPDTFTRWLKTLETQPLTGIISAAFAVVAFPFFTLWLFLKALGARKLKQFEQEYSHKSEEPKEDFTEFEEIESTPLDKMPEPDIVEAPPAKEDKEPKDKENPYDSFFG